MTNTFHLGVDEAFANSGFSVLEHDVKTDKLVYVESFVFHPSNKLNQKSDAIALLEHNHHVKTFYESRAAAGKPIASTCIEGLAVASPGFAATRGSVWGVYALHCLTISDLIVCAPRSLKLFATGSGKAEKPEVREAVVKRFGLEDKMKTRKKISFDECDALVLAEVGYWAWRIMHEGEAVAENLESYQKDVLLSDKISPSSKKPAGICKRVDDFYMFKR